MVEFFLLLLILFVAIPIVKAAVGIYRARKAAREFFENMRNAANPYGGGANGFDGSQSRKSRGNKTQNQQPPKKKKKITPDVGEYVDYQEVRLSEEEIKLIYQRHPAADSRNINSESRVSDAEWEDLD